MARALARTNLSRTDSALVGSPMAMPQIDGRGASIANFAALQSIFVQGEPCDALYYLCTGIAKVLVTSKSGQEAVVVILAPGDFFGEGCMLENVPRVATVTTMTECTVERIDAGEAKRRLHNDPTFLKKFMAFLVRRNRQYIRDLRDQHFHSIEKRLARTLLRLAKTNNNESAVALARLSQETLASMIGAERARVNFFMNKFRRLGMIEYTGNSDDKLIVHPSLRDILSAD
jgi:CRP/FNR family transcriptional regulator, cyclic AMP receptor protein